MPAHAGIHDLPLCGQQSRGWPTCAGMTEAPIVRTVRRFDYPASSPKAVSAMAEGTINRSNHAPDVAELLSRVAEIAQADPTTANALPAGVYTSPAFYEAEQVLAAAQTRA
jgi:hypothetical protein